MISIFSYQLQLPSRLGDILLRRGHAAEAFASDH